MHDNSTMGDAPQTGKILSQKEVEAKIGLATTTIYNLRQKRKFPEPFKVGMRKNGWYEAAIDDWIQSKTIH